MCDARAASDSSISNSELGLYGSALSGAITFENNAGDNGTLVYAALLVMCTGLVTALFRVRDRLLAWQKGMVQW